MHAIVLAVMVLAGAEAQEAGAKVNPDAQNLAAFQAHVAKYMALHDRLEKEAPPLEKTSDPARIRESQVALAKKIQAARRGARQGEIFTPEIRRTFRRIMQPHMQGAAAAEIQESIREDAPRVITLRVNASYPENAPLPTVPPKLLAALPALPEDLEYRFIGRDLILRDVHANLIVDFMQNALR